MKHLLLGLSILLLSFQSFSQTKAQKYEIYKLKCNVIDTFKIKEARYLKYDTLVVATYPIKDTYYGKVILNKIKINSKRTLIAVVDTVSYMTATPIYMFGNPTKTVIPIPYDKNPNHWVYRTKTIIARRIKPVTYTVWTKNEAYYDKLLVDTNNTILYLKTAK